MFRRIPRSDITLSLPLPSLKHLLQFELARDPSMGSMQNREPLFKFSVPADRKAGHHSRNVCSSSPLSTRVIICGW